MSQDWRTEVHDPGRFDRFLRRIKAYREAVLVAAIDHILVRRGIDLVGTEWCKSLGNGLYEFRVRQSLRAVYSIAGVEPDATFISVPNPDETVQLRVFCTFHGDRIVLLLSGYDKGKDPSRNKQNREIKAARKLLKEWKRSPA